MKGEKSMKKKSATFENYKIIMIQATLQEKAPHSQEQNYRLDISPRGASPSL